MTSLSQLYPDIEKDKSILRYYTYLSMILAPFGQYKQELKSKKTELAMIYLIKESIKVILILEKMIYTIQGTNKDTEIMTLINEYRPKLSDLVHSQEISNEVICETGMINFMNNLNCFLKSQDY